MKKPRQPIPQPASVPAAHARWPWNRLREFCGLGNDDTLVWARWLLLRAVGLLFIVIFWGIIGESRALLGPEGITPIAGTLANARQQASGAFAAFVHSPSLFWLDGGWGMIVALQWLGLASAVAVVLNLWPRMALFGCWVTFLSFNSSSPFFAQTQPDPLILELTLLCIPFAPAGFRPGLAASAGPRPIAVFALRFMLLRLMAEAGLAKFVFGGTMWSSFTAMDVMYETAPFPTVIGHWLYFLPHWFHVLEIGVTFAAECIAPVVMIFGGRRGRWFAFIVWAFFQLGIQFTNNFAWLNLGAIGMALILLDDQMLAAAAQRFRLNRLAAYLREKFATIAPARPRPWALHGLRAALGLQFAVCVYAYVVTPVRLSPERLPDSIVKPMNALQQFYGANSYALFGSLPMVRYEVEFQGSNDSGETWRSFEFRYKVQSLDRVSPFVAPWYPRFDAILQHVRVSHGAPDIYFATAERLIQRNPAVMALFKADPFPERPPTAIRMIDYRYDYNDEATWRATGHSWRKTLIGDWQPMIYRNAKGEIVAEQ